MSVVLQPLLGSIDDIDTYERYPHKNPGLSVVLRPVSTAVYSINQRLVQSTRHAYGRLVVDIQLIAGGAVKVRITPYQQKKHELATLHTSQLEQDLEAVYAMRTRLLAELEDVSLVKKG